MVRRRQALRPHPFAVFRVSVSGVCFLSSSVFTPIAAGAGSRLARTEQLFHAAVSAFSALTRPSRAEITRIDDLTLPLLDHVSTAGKRFAAAAFSDSAYAPLGLVRRLCEESVDIAAPLLVRSPLLADTDLVALIGRHGAAHAKAIARRPDLHPAIASLIQLLQREKPEAASPMPETPEAKAPVGADPVVPAAASAGEATEGTRQKLRTMMGDASNHRHAAAPNPRALFARLRDTALDAHRPLFETALADATGLSLDAARRIAADGANALPRALHALGLRAEEAFLIVAALHPEVLSGRDAVRAFLDCCRSAAEAAPHRPHRGQPHRGGAAETPRLKLA